MKKGSFFKSKHKKFQEFFCWVKKKRQARAWCRVLSNYLDMTHTVLLRLKSGQLTANQIWEFCYRYDYFGNQLPMSNQSFKFKFKFNLFHWNALTSPKLQSLPGLISLKEGSLQHAPLLNFQEYPLSPLSILQASTALLAASLFIQAFSRGLLYSPFEMESLLAS